MDVKFVLCNCKLRHKNLHDELLCGTVAQQTSSKSKLVMLVLFER